MTTVLIADDHPLVRRALRDLIASLSDMEVVGEAATGAQVVEQALVLRPDVVVMDLKMPEVDGIEATRRLTEEMPDIAVLVLTMHEDDDSVFAAMRAGARGYLLKGAEQDEIVRAIQAVSSGQAIFGPGVAQRMCSTSLPARRDSRSPSLSSRPGARGPRPHLLGRIQPGHRTASRDQLQDGQQPHLGDLHQAPGR